MFAGHGTRFATRSPRRLRRRSRWSWIRSVCGADRPRPPARLDLIRSCAPANRLVRRQLALAAYQRRLAEQLGIEPGASQSRGPGGRQRELPVHMTTARSADLQTRLQQAGWWGRPTSRRLWRPCSPTRKRRRGVEKLTQATCSNPASANSPSKPALYEVRDRDATATCHRALCAIARRRARVCRVTVPSTAGLASTCGGDRAPACARGTRIAARKLGALVPSSVGIRARARLGFLAQAVSTSAPTCC